MNPLPCPDCSDGFVVDYDRHDRGQSSGASQTCSTCHGANVAKCFWRLTPRCSRVADRLLEGEPCCASCFATSVLDAAADRAGMPAVDLSEVAQ